MIRVLIAALLLSISFASPADSQSQLLLLGVTSAPPACTPALNLSQPCNSANLDLL